MRYLLLLLLLSGCAQAPTTIYDTETTKPVTIVWHKTENAWAAYVKERGGRLDATTNGFYLIRDGTCHIYAPDPKVIDRKYTNSQWATLGHEIKHCFDGRFHD